VAKSAKLPNTALRRGLLCIVLVLSACRATSAPSGDLLMTDSHFTTDPLVETILPRLLADPRARPLLDELVRDWRREAGDDPDAAEILALLQTDLEVAFTAQTPTACLERVFAEVVDRRLRVLARRSWAAGSKLAKGTLDDDSARIEGRAVLTAADALVADVRAVTGSLSESLRQALEDVLLEGLYLVERKAMSRRFQEIFHP
jgi:hypothetical protein